MIFLNSQRFVSCHHHCGAPCTGLGDCYNYLFYHYIYMLMQCVCSRGKLSFPTGKTAGKKEDFFAFSTGICKCGELTQPSRALRRDVQPSTGKRA